MQRDAQQGAAPQARLGLPPAAQPLGAVEGQGTRLAGDVFMIGSRLVCDQAANALLAG